MPVKSSSSTACSRTMLQKRTLTHRPLYASQSAIPHLPVPSISSTLHKYTESLSPLLSPTQLQHSSLVVKKFVESGQANTLQKRLQERAQATNNWLSEWWNETAYMGYRDRILPNVSYFYSHKLGLGKGKSQIERAAELVRATVEFKKLVDSELLEPEKIKGQPLCMASYKYLFNSTRQPTKPADVAKSHGPDNHHIVVLCNNRYFKVDTKSRGLEELSQALKKIKKVAEQHAGESIGVLTADNRDVWTDARNYLLSLSSTNKSSIKTIDSAIILLCLDAAPPRSAADARAWSFWVGGYSSESEGKGFNRWFDKHEIIVDSNGESGFNGEHSMLDGTPTLRLNEFILASLDHGKIPLELPESERATSSMPEPEEIKFVLDNHIRDVIKQSQKGFAEEIAQQSLHMAKYKGYGKNVIKTYRTSPDAYVQLIKQLAFYTLFNRMPTVYESCQTRKFLLGRTEVVRSVSQESKAFVESMYNPKATDEEREKLYRKAVERHVQYCVWAADGQGVDRHLFGLKKLIEPSEPIPEIFTDPAFAKSSHWELSTSNLGSKYLDGWGYGEVVSDGYGLSYSIEDDELKWGITTKRKDVDAMKMGKALGKAADELRGMLDRATFKK
nr:carnitine O-acetyltransferase [Cryptococcus depauperatus CBS 7841]